MSPQYRQRPNYSAEEKRKRKKRPAGRISFLSSPKQRYISQPTEEEGKNTRHIIVVRRKIFKDGPFIFFFSASFFVVAWFVEFGFYLFFVGYVQQKLYNFFKINSNLLRSILKRTEQKRLEKKNKTKKFLIITGGMHLRAPGSFCWTVAIILGQNKPSVGNGQLTVPTRGEV